MIVIDNLLIITEKTIPGLWGQILHPLRDLEHPKDARISLIRKTLNMSLRQPGERLSLFLWA
jgi:hypothetical protein